MERFNLKLLDNLGVGLFRQFWKKKKGIFKINKSLANILGFNSAERPLFGQLEDFFAASNYRRKFRRLLEKESKVRFFEAPLKRIDRGIVWVAITAEVTKKNGDIYEEGLVEDISAHKEIENRLNEEREMLQSLLDNIPDAIYFKDKSCRLVKVNKFHAQGMGLRPEEVIGKTDFDFFPYGQARKMYEDDLWVIKSGKPIVGKVESTLLPNGTWNRVLTTKIPRFNHRGKIIGLMGITRDMTALANWEEEKLRMTTDTVRALAKVVEMRDPYTVGHSNRVGLISEMIAREMGWNDKRALGIRMAGELHDIGKIAIPLDILSKTAHLTYQEYRLIQKHPLRSYEIVKDIDFPFPLAEAVYQHHERIDGSGYPRGLKGAEITKEARIIAVSDVLEAMSLMRPYRAALGVQAALDELKSGAGRRYDKEVVKIAEKILQRVNFRPFWIELEPN
ncbi:MAG: HD domain-containing protein [Candidatus Omnitrophica bacterium]|nr:HD domain-containing protein [Candidatus Omnitrophota bacterium]